jgi:hypothetical protein
MPNIPDAALNEMLKQLPKETRKSLAHLVSGKISHQVHCMGEDTYESVEVPVLDEDDKPVLDENEQPVTETERRLVREGCKGEVIAYFYIDGVDQNGRPTQRVEPVVKEDKSMKLRSVRKRLDGNFGFQCWCGNDSRLARQERGSIGFDGLAPTRAGLEAIYGELQKDPGHYPEINGVTEVDGFQIERV